MPTHSRKNILHDKQCVILKGRHDGISILLDSKADFELIKDVLRMRVAGSRNFFEGAQASVTFKGRVLTDNEELMLLDIIKQETNLSVAATVAEEVKTSTLGLIPVAPTWMLPSESETFYYQGSIRSGQTIRQNGSVVIVGDVNPGAEVKSTGNVIVLGSLKGIAWAGAPVDDEGLGDASFFVSALDFRPTQIRIAHYITYLPTDSPEHSRGAWAYIQSGQVYITPL